MHSYSRSFINQASSDFIRGDGKVVWSQVIFFHLQCRKKNNKHNLFSVIWSFSVISSTFSVSIILFVFVSSIPWLTYTVLHPWPACSHPSLSLFMTFSIFMTCESMCLSKDKPKKSILIFFFNYERKMDREEIILHNTVAGKRWHYLLWICKRICGKLRTLTVNVWGVYKQLYPKSDGKDNVLDMDVSSFQFLLPCFSTWLCFSDVRSTVFVVIYGVYWHHINLLTDMAHEFLFTLYCDWWTSLLWWLEWFWFSCWETTASDLTYDFMFLFHNISRCLFPCSWLEVMMQSHTASQEVSVFSLFFLLFPHPSSSGWGWPWRQYIAVGEIVGGFQKIVWHSSRSISNPLGHFQLSQKQTWTLLWNERTMSKVDWVYSQTKIVLLFN